MCYIYEGEGYFGAEKRRGAKNDTIVLKRDVGQVLEVETKDSEVKFILLAGMPLKERICQYRLFVLENKEDLAQTFEDYDEAKNGFE